MKPKVDFIPSILEELKAHADAQQALAMKKYMKDHFVFYGVKAPLRKTLSSPYFSEFKSLDGKGQKKCIDRLWAQEERECQYIALDFAVKSLKKMDESWLAYWEDKVKEKSWWDTVDAIASHCLGQVMKNNKDAAAKAWQWTEDEDMWMQRSAIIFQLKYKASTNSQLLFDVITAQAENKEFFIRKACGWALREFSRTNPLAVSEFINQYRAILSPLTIKEGERLMKLHRP